MVMPTTTPDPIYKVKYDSVVRNLLVNLCYEDGSFTPVWKKSLEKGESPTSALDLYREDMRIAVDKHRLVTKQVEEFERRMAEKIADIEEYINGN